MGAEFRAGEGGGGEVRLVLTAAEVEALGPDAVVMAELLDSCFWALGMLRTGRNTRDPGGGVPVPGDWVAAVRGLDRLPPRVRAVVDAVLREYAAGPGQVRHLAAALGVDEAEVRARAGRPRDAWEEWAGGGTSGGRHRGV
ncbi:hypothetical protein [Streptomyces sp. NPDC049881]|uniref:hypothetical protein n=1 Tax=Streptomyces sp. NPDC049881 TaxID=3155778 RepID=UPI0034471407